MKIAPSSFLPPIIRRLEHAYGRSKPWHTWAEGAVLFADVSGFTPLSEALSVLGAEGAEMLNAILNRYFSAMIGIVHAHGGDVMKFGGDAILCFFPGNDTLPHAMSAARRMQESMRKFSRIKTPIAYFSLRMKIGIAAGETLLAGVGDPRVRCEFVFAGAPVDLTSDAEHHAVAGDIVLACSREDLPAGGFGLEEIEAGFYRVHDAPVIDGIQVHQGDAEDATIVEPYVIDEILTMVDQGFERYIGILQSSLPVFVKFTGFSYNKGAFDLARFDAFFSTVMNVTHQYQGRLNHLSMGDKGSTFYLLFGAPVPLEKKEELACSWALALMETIATTFPDIVLGIGMNAGRIFSGIVGGSNRYDFTSLGDAVNVAARLMQKAGPHQILISDAIYRKVHETCRGEFLGEHTFKGKAAPLPVYRIISRKESLNSGAGQDLFVGRSEELRRLLTLFEQAAAGNPTMAILEGEAGVGKSAIARQILLHATNSEWRVCSARGDVTRQSHEYGPWSDCFRSLFFAGKSPDEEQIKTVLEEHHEYNESTMGLLCEFFHIILPDHSETVGDVAAVRDVAAKQRQQRLLVSLFLKKATIRPTVIFFDDLQWFDSLSLELLSSLLDHSRAGQLLFLATTRPVWSGDNFRTRPYCHLITVCDMRKSDIRPLTERILGGPVRDDLVDVLDLHTRGNPFFLHQIVGYLQENGFLETRLGQWTIRKGACIEKSLSGEEVIISRIERLTPREKIHIRFAACIGMTFPLSVMKLAMGTLYHESTWQTLMDRTFFTVLEDDIYSFHHAIIQDTIYQSIPQKVRQGFHRRIGQAIEKARAVSLEQWYPNLANHFYLAQSRHKAVHYSFEAGLRLTRSQMYIEACRFLERAYSLMKHTSDQRKWKTAINLSMMYLKIGRPDDCIALSRKIAVLARKRKLHNVYFRACINQCEAMLLRSDFSYIPLLQKILLHPSLRQPYKKDVLSHLGFALEQRGQFKEAKNVFRTVSKLRKSYKDEESRKRDYQASVPALHRLARMAGREGDSDEAKSLLDRALVLARAVGNAELELNVCMEQATLMINNGDYKPARPLYDLIIARCEELGNLSLLGICLLNCGDLHLYLEDTRAAVLYVQESLSIFSRLGYEVGVGKACNLLGVIAFQRHEFAESYRFYADAVRTFERIHHAEETIMGYYNLAEVCAELGRFDEARAWRQKFIELGPSLPAGLFTQSSRELTALIERKEAAWGNAAP